MLYLSGGATIDVITRRLQEAGYRWAYRVIDSRFTGLAQRRRRVFLLASLSEDPAPILLGPDAGPPTGLAAADAVGFSWTEGNRGLGWTVGGVPTLRGGSTVQVASPPAVWLGGREPGAAIVVPSIEACEVLQGFSAGWTERAPQRDRWKLTGNAVSTRVARWIGHQMRWGCRQAVWDESVHEDGRRWPRAARWDGEKRWDVAVSEWPAHPPHGEQQDLALVLQYHGWQPLSYRAAAGFRSRLLASRLQYPAAFLDALNDHIDYQRAAT
jgi:DNA (cytosine-5)-methyltransferase 1